jgi:hypothetical protein
MPTPMLVVFGRVLKVDSATVKNIQLLQIAAYTAAQRRPDHTRNGKMKDWLLSLITISMPATWRKEKGRILI